MSTSSATEPLRDVVDESLEEATFLWGRWESELTSLTRSLDEVWSWTEDRLHGALDGVRVAGDAVIDIAASALKSDDLNQIAVGAALLSSRSDKPAIKALLEALVGSEDDKMRSVLRGLELMGSNQALRAAAAALAAGGAAGAGPLCRLKAFRRAPLGAEATVALRSDPRSQADVLASVFYPAAGDFSEGIESGLASPDAAVRLAASEAGLARGLTSALAAVRRLAGARDATAGPHLRLLALFGSPEEHELVYSALRIPDQRKDAVWALGHLGTVRAVEACLAGMRHEHLARGCGEAYCWITGADLSRDHLEKLETAPEAPPFEDDDLDANLVPAPDELWPMPDADAVQAHWQSRRDGFTPDVRYAHGQPVSVTRLIDLVETGPMLRRPDVVLELRGRTRGAYDVETRAFAARQRQMMATARAAASAGGR